MIRKEQMKGRKGAASTPARESHFSFSPIFLSHASASLFVCVSYYMSHPHSAIFYFCVHPFHFFLLLPVFFSALYVHVLLLSLLCFSAFFPLSPSVWLLFSSDAVMWRSLSCPSSFLLSTSQCFSPLSLSLSVWLFLVPANGRWTQTPMEKGLSSHVFFSFLFSLFVCLFLFFSLFSSFFLSVSLCLFRQHDVEAKYYADGEE